MNSRLSLIIIILGVIIFFYHLYALPLVARCDRGGRKRFEKLILSYSLKRFARGHKILSKWCLTALHVMGHDNNGSVYIFPDLATRYWHIMSRLSKGQT